MVHLSERRNALAKEFQEAIRPYYSNNMIDLFGNHADTINMNSQQQLMDLFNNKLNLNLPSTGDALLALHNEPIVKLLRNYRGYEKLLSAFGDSLLSKINPGSTPSSTSSVPQQEDFLALLLTSSRFREIPKKLLLERVLIPNPVTN